MSLAQARYSNAPLRGWRYVRLNGGATRWRATAIAFDGFDTRIPVILPAGGSRVLVAKWLRRQSWIAHLIGTDGEVIHVQ